MGRPRSGFLLVLPALAAFTAIAGAQTVRANVASDGKESAFPALDPAVTGDGRYVAFASDADDLVAGDDNQVSDVFVRDLVAGTIERVSVGDAEQQGDQLSWGPSLSADGRYVAFTSFATNFVVSDTNNTLDAFVRDRVAGTTVRASVDSTGAQAKLGGFADAISSDGAVVAFHSKSGDLVAGDDNDKQDVFVKEFLTGLTEQVSVDSDELEGPLESFNAGLSADGSRVVFESFSPLAPPSNGGNRQIFVRDRALGTTELASITSSGTLPDAECYGTSISGDGMRVVFHSGARNMVPHDENHAGDVFGHDFLLNLTVRVSVDANGEEADLSSHEPVISADGRHVVFTSYATNLVPEDVNFSADVFTKDFESGRVRRVSIDSKGLAADFESSLPAVSAHGETIAFESVATNLVSDDANGRRDVFAWIRSGILANVADYGVGFPGENGVPTLTASGSPAIGTRLSLSATNASSRWTVGFLLIGTERTDFPLKSGASLLTLPVFTLPVALTNSGWSSAFDLPDDSTLCGAFACLQMIELDPKAAGGLAFSAGLELLLGEEP